MVLDDGSSYGGNIELQPETGEYRLLLKDLQPVKTVTLPRPYPDFLPYYLKHNIKTHFDINKIESIQLSIGPGIQEDKRNDKYGIAVRAITLE